MLALLVIFFSSRGNNKKITDPTGNVVRNRKSYVDKVELAGYGIVEVTVMNRDGKGGRALAVHGMALSVVHEWDLVGMELAKNLDFQVYIPNMHSNFKTKPSSSNSRKALLLIMKHYNLDNNILILGKSWGTTAAAFLVCREGSLASWARAIILANPVNEEYLPCMHSGGIPLLYLSNEDDHAIRSLASYKKEWGMDKKLTLFIGNKGGHTITNEFTNPIMNFVQANYL